MCISLCGRISFNEVKAVLMKGVKGCLFGLSGKLGGCGGVLEVMRGHVGKGGRYLPKPPTGFSHRALRLALYLSLDMTTGKLDPPSLRVTYPGSSSIVVLDGEKLLFNPFT
jgi:hypothetical protein